MKIGTKTDAGAVTAVDAQHRDRNRSRRADSRMTTLAFNEIGEAQLSLETVVACDPYVENRETGGFILIDRITNETVAVGMVKTVAASERAAPKRRSTELSYASMEGVPIERGDLSPDAARAASRRRFSWLLPASLSTFLSSRLRARTRRSPRKSPAWK